MKKVRWEPIILKETELQNLQISPSRKKNNISQYGVQDMLSKNDPFIKLNFLNPQAQKIIHDSETLIQIPHSSNLIQDPSLRIFVEEQFSQNTQLLLNKTLSLLNQNQINNSEKLSELHENNIQEDAKISEKEEKDIELNMKLIETKVEVIREKRLELLQQNKVVKNIWKRSWFSILYYASKMKKIAQQIKLFHQPFLLQPFQVRLINDLSSNQESKYTYDKYKYIHLLKFDILKTLLSKEKYKWLIKNISIQIGKFLAFKMMFQKYFEYILAILFQYLPLYHNLSRFYIFWETIIFITCSINFIYLPFEYSFLNERSKEFSFHISVLTPFILGLDIFIKFNTKSYEQGNLLDQHIQIAKNYITSSFLVDLASLVFLNQQLFGFQSTYFLFFLRFFRSTRILELFREQFLLNLKISVLFVIMVDISLLRLFFINNEGEGCFNKGIDDGLISLIFLFSLALYYGHLFACTWNAVGLYQAKYNEGWIIFYGQINQSVWQRYTDSLYFSIVTMTTIGYGDITAQSNIEKILMIFFTFVSCGVFGYTINSIGNILYDFKLKRDKYLQELAKINQYFKQYDVSLTLQGSARRYIKYLYSDERQDQFCSISLISNLSEHLKVEIKKDIFTKRLKLIKLFRENFKEEFLIQLSLKMQENIYSSDQIILNSSTETEPCIRIINSGTILKYAQYDPKSEIKPIQKLEFGKHFGMTEFFLDERNSEFSYKSVEITSILSLSLSDFLQIAKQYNDQQEIFQYLRDQVKFQKSYHKIFTFCPSCKQKDHTLKECQYIFYEGKKSTIIQNYLKDCKNQIHKYHRKYKNYQCHALSSNKDINQIINNYQQDHINQLSMFEFSTNFNEDDYGEMDNLFEEKQTRNSIQITRKNLENEYKSQERIQEDSLHQYYPHSQYISQSSFTGNPMYVQRRKKNMPESVSQDEYQQYASQYISHNNSHQQFEGLDGSQRQININPQSISLLDQQNKTNNEINNINNNNLLNSTNNSPNFSLFMGFHISLINRIKDLKICMQQMNQQINQINQQRIGGSRSSLTKIKNNKDKKQNINESMTLDQKKKYDQLQQININQFNYETVSYPNNLFFYNFEKIEKFEIYYPLENYELIIDKFTKNQTIKINSLLFKKQKNEFVKVFKKKKKFQ